MSTLAFKNHYPNRNASFEDIRFKNANKNHLKTKNKKTFESYISANTLAMMDSSMENFKKGVVSEPIELPEDSLESAMNDVLNRTNLSQPFTDVDEAINSMLEE